MNEQSCYIGYIRTSSTDYYPNVQADALKRAGCTEPHEGDSQIAQRQALQEVLALLGNSGTLVIYRMDRLSRDGHSVKNFQQQFKATGVELVFTSEHDGDEDANAE